MSYNTQLIEMLSCKVPLEKGGLETMLKKMIGHRASMVPTAATAATHKIVIVACPLHVPSISPVPTTM